MRGFLWEKQRGFMVHALIGYWPLMLENRSQLFIAAKNKSLSWTATDNRGTKAIFAARIILGSFFRRESTSGFDVIRGGILTLSESKLPRYEME